MVAGFDIKWYWF